LSAILQTSYDPYDWRGPNKCLGVGPKWGDDDIRDSAYPAPEEERQNEIHNAPINQRIEELQKTLEAKAAPLRLKLRAEKLEKLPAEVRKDLQQAADTLAEKRTEIGR